MVKRRGKRSSTGTLKSAKLSASRKVVRGGKRRTATAGKLSKTKTNLRAKSSTAKSDAFQSGYARATSDFLKAFEKGAAERSKAIQKIEQKLQKQFSNQLTKKIKPKQQKTKTTAKKSKKSGMKSATKKSGRSGLKSASASRSGLSKGGLKRSSSNKGRGRPKKPEAQAEAV